MLSRPTFSIRRLMPLRKPDSPDGDQSHEVDEGCGKARTWSRRFSKAPIPSIDIRRSQDVHCIVVLPPLPDTPRTSTSSVYSEEDTRFTRPRSSPTPPGPARTPQGSPLLTPQQLYDRRRPQSLSLAPPTPPSLSSSSVPSSPLSRTWQADFSPVSSLESLESPPPANASTPELKLKECEPEMDRLAREMEEAFRLWQSATEGLPSPPPSASGMSDDATRDTVSVKRVSLDRRRSQRSTRSASSITKPTKAPLKTSTPSGQMSVLRTKKARLRRSFRQGPRGRATWPVAPTPSPRWTLTGSAKDLFSIRFFNRVEADEMLPESVLHEIRMSRATQARLAREAATAVRDLDGELGPTGSDEIVSDEGPAIQVMIEEPREIQHTNANEKQPAPTQLDHIESPIDSAMIYNFDEGAPPIMMVVEEIQPAGRQMNNLPLPPIRKNHRRRSPMKQMAGKASLPTIPEVIAVGPETSVLSPTSRRKGTTERVNTDEYVYLRSSPYSYCCPGFRHGPIRLAKADLPFIGKLAAAVDDTLDWTAFQMAIIGGAGDFFGETTDYSKPSDAELAERDDVARWFADFGFDGPGTLVTAADAEVVERQNRHSTPPDTPVHTPPPAPSPVRLPPSTAELDTKEVLPPPPRYSSIVRPAHPPQYFYSTGIGIGQEGVMTYHSRNGGLGGASGGLQIDADAAARRESTESMQSLPQSPMLDLVVSRDVEGNEYIVPMGFNLGHDLGDFLRWEAENVFGGGFYGPDTL
ncbi:hypothetical protein QBC47DRAFT_59623 [Echria macrotheca]|uniref:Uncharacterized protein n=1 Tax=Echria macrotheca TaxID=438768 RepID=A0AAJ0F8U8_9PEZI|nr:hypothetical protein QBC47DRAFT_59623 [Echria macrotheca]